MPGRGEIDVKFEADAFLTSIEVFDQGTGIPSEHLERVFDRGFSRGKAGGAAGGEGLGLYFAKKLIEDHQGNIEIRSVVGVGTRVILNFQRLKTPEWHLSKLEFSDADDVTICDDQPIIHKAWEFRFRALAKAPRARFVFSCEEIGSAIKSGPGKRLLLLDYDLGPGKQNGIDFARTMADRSGVVLVTGHFDDPKIQASCRDLGIKLIAKDEISRIEIA